MEENSKEYKQMIKDLRVSVERSVEKLKNLEITGTENDANSALWIVTAIWNGREYSAIESMLIANGHSHKSCLEDKIGSIHCIVSNNDKEFLKDVRKGSFIEKRK
jgi:hypothetical protein